MDKQSSPPGREIIVLPQQTVHTVHLSLQWEKVKLGKGLQCIYFQQSIWLSPEQHLLQGQPAVIASCSQTSPTRPCWRHHCPGAVGDPANGTERKYLSENITLTQTIADK